MNYLKLVFAFTELSASTMGVTQSAFANDEGKACDADGDCEHGEHCKDGHCHK